MKNKMQDVRNHLVAMMESLADREVAGDVIDRAKTTSMLANSYVQAVRCELDALKLYDETKLLPTAIESEPRMRVLEGDRAV